MTSAALQGTHPGIFGFAKETATLSWLSSVYEVLDDQPAPRPKVGWMGATCALDNGPEIVGPYAASSLRLGSSSAGSSGSRSEETESLGAMAIEPNLKTKALALQTQTAVTPKRQLNRNAVDSAKPVTKVAEPAPKVRPRRQLQQGKGDPTRYLLVPGAESDLEAAVSQPNFSSICLNERLSQMQKAVAQLESSSGGAPLVLLHQTEAGIQPEDGVEGNTAVVAEVSPTSEHEPMVDRAACLTVATKAKSQGENASPLSSRRNSDFIFTPSELVAAHERWNALMEARERGAATKPLTQRDASPVQRPGFRSRGSSLAIVQRRGFRSARESRDFEGELVKLADDLDPSSDL